MRLFCLTDFSSDLFDCDFVLKNGINRKRPADINCSETFSSLVSKYAIHRNCFGDLHLWCGGRFLEVDPVNGYYLGALLFKKKLVLPFDYVFPLSHDWFLAYLTHCFNQMEFKIHSANLDEYVQGQKRNLMKMRTNLEYFLTLIDT